MLKQKMMMDRCVYVRVCRFVGADGFIPLTMPADGCQCCRLLKFVCLRFSRHFPCCKTWSVNKESEIKPERRATRLAGNDWDLEQDEAMDSGNSTHSAPQV